MELVLARRKILSVGNSLCITLPRQWLETMHIEKGAPVKIIMGKNGVLEVVPDAATGQPL